MKKSDDNFFNGNFLSDFFDKEIINWHRIKSSKKIYSSVLAKKVVNKTILLLLYYNYTLWHLEDKARVKNVSDSVIADVKRNIDTANQLRNNTIELIDELIEKKLNNVKLLKNSYLSTETIGAAIDRLSIISLKIFHMKEETLRKDADSEHKIKCGSKLQVLMMQRAGLAEAINILYEKIGKGMIQHKIYRQMKMYNDPSLNPEVYKSK
ncbi:DUF4254 domain-containing protein [Candidatus Dependentiae bacterium]|nr:DUF4254 domain-containing protein [Candidatus Dependentiae bacterium]